MMLYSYGGRFLEGWLWGMRLSSSGPDQTALHVFSEAFALRFVREFFAMSRVLAGFTFLGFNGYIEHRQAAESVFHQARRPAY